MSDRSPEVETKRSSTKAKVCSSLSIVRRTSSVNESLVGVLVLVVDKCQILHTVCTLFLKTTHFHSQYMVINPSGSHFGEFAELLVTWIMLRL